MPPHDAPRNDRTRTRPPGGARPSGLLEQFARTRGAFRGLIGAHFDLLRAELGEIFAEIRRLGVQAGIILVIALLVGNLLFIGGFLFLGEWLFGSLGWGVAHGALLGLGLIVSVALFMLGAPRGPILGAFALAALVAIGLGVLLASNVVHNTAASVGQQIVAPLNTAEGLATVTGAVVVGLLLALVLGRVGGAGGAVAGLVIGVLLGAGLGYVIGSLWTLPPAAGFAILIGLVLWPVFAFALAWPKLDPAERFSRLKPTQTMETVAETREWLEKEWKSRRPKLGRE
jgi:MFS family permease